MLPTIKAKLVAAIACACQAIWLKKILEELHFKQEEAIVIYCDNNSAIKLSKNTHIDVEHHFLRDLTNNQEIDFFSTIRVKTRLPMSLISPSSWLVF